MNLTKDELITLMLAKWSVLGTAGVGIGWAIDKIVRFIV